jgi:flagellin FlaB
MAKLLLTVRLRGQKKGEIGISTLIIFIALILVAAIAASVIISTVFSLRDQAISTASAAQQEVAGPLKILNFYGNRTVTTNAGIQFLVFHVAVFSGSDGINMTKMRINYIDSQVSVVFTMLPCSTAGNPSSGFSYNATEVPVAAGNGWDPTNNLCFLDRDNILEIWIPVTSANAAGLLPGIKTTLAFLPGSGPAVVKTFTTPNSYDNNIIIPLL